MRSEDIVYRYIFCKLCSRLGSSCTGVGVLYIRHVNTRKMYIIHGSCHPAVVTTRSCRCRYDICTPAVTVRGYVNEPTHIQPRSDDRNSLLSKEDSEDFISRPKRMSGCEQPRRKRNMATSFAVATHHTNLAWSSGTCRENGDDLDGRSHQAHCDLRHSATRGWICIRCVVGFANTAIDS